MNCQKRGEAIAVRGDYVAVRFPRCEGCDGCGRCSALYDSRNVQIKALNGIGANVGDIVTVVIPEKRATLFTALAYMIPMAFALAGLLVAIYASVLTGLLIAACGAGVGGIAATLVDRLAIRPKFQPYLSGFAL